jgi:hypothetical protein
VYIFFISHRTKMIRKADGRVQKRINNRKRYKCYNGTQSSLK